MHRIAIGKNGMVAAGGGRDKEEREVEAYVVQRYLQYPLLIGKCCN